MNNKTPKVPASSIRAHPSSMISRKAGPAATKLYTIGINSKNYLPAPKASTPITNNKLRLSSSPTPSKMQLMPSKSKKNSKLLSRTSISTTKVQHPLHRSWEQEESRGSQQTQRGEEDLQDQRREVEVYQSRLSQRLHLGIKRLKRLQLPQGSPGFPRPQKVLELLRQGNHGLGWLHETAHLLLRLALAQIGLIHKYVMRCKYGSFEGWYNMIFKCGLGR